MYRRRYTKYMGVCICVCNEEIVLWEVYLCTEEQLFFFGFGGIETREEVMGLDLCV